MTEGEPFDFHEKRDQFLGWVFLTAFAGCEDKAVCEAIVNAERPHRVQFIVDGHDLGFDRTVSRLKEEYEHRVEKRALELVRERFGELIEKVRVAEDVLTEALEDAMSKARLQLRD